jgi:activator of HSP90 ATPase
MTSATHGESISKNIAIDNHLSIKLQYKNRSASQGEEDLLQMFFSKLFFPRPIKIVF